MTMAEPADSSDLPRWLSVTGRTPGLSVDASFEGLSRFFGTIPPTRILIVLWVNAYQ